MAEDSKILGQEMQKVYRLITNAFTKTSLQRGIKTKKQIAELKSLQSKIRGILNSKTVVNNLSTKQFLELQNYTNDYLSQYTNSRIEKETPKTSKSFKEQVKQEKLIEQQKKVEQLKQHQESKARITVLKPNISDTSKQSLTGLIKSAESIAGIKPSNVVVGSSSTALVPNRPDRINFNLKGFALIHEIALNSAAHGYLDSDIDEGIKQKKITASEAKNIKKFFNKNNISSHVKQVTGNIDKAKQFYRPEYQKSFRNFLFNQYNEVFTKIPKDITPPKGGGGSPSGPQGTFGKKFLKAGAGAAATIPGGGPKTPMRRALGMYDPFETGLPYLKKGGKVKPKPKPYAMGGKVYSNSIRKPKLI